MCLFPRTWQYLQYSTAGSCIAPCGIFSLPLAEAATPRVTNQNLTGISDSPRTHGASPGSPLRGIASVSSDALVSDNPRSKLPGPNEPMGRPSLQLMRFVGRRPSPFHHAGGVFRQKSSHFPVVKRRCRPEAAISGTVAIDQSLQLLFRLIEDRVGGFRSTLSSACDMKLHTR